MLGGVHTPEGYAIVRPMEAHAEHSPAHAHHHHEMPTGGSALTGVAVSATLHCLTGCAIGEVAGMAIGTALGFSDFATIVLAVGLAFVFGYTLTSLPLLRAGLALSAVVPIALASDTLSIATMEVVDNLIMVAVPGAMDAGLDSLLFWGSLSFALAIAFVLTVPVNRWLLARGKGHTAVHETGIHGGPPTRLVGAAVIVAFVFGTSVVVAEAIINEDTGRGGMDGHGAMAASENTGAMNMVIGSPHPHPGAETQLSFRITGEGGAAITDFDIEHTKPMHLIVVRRDLTGFQHLHPRMAADGTWTAPITLTEPGTYRAFADFSHGGEAQTVGADLTVAGDAEYRPLPPPQPTASAGDGYEVELADVAPVAGSESELAFTVTRDGEPVAVEPYLGADGHLVALSEGDLEFLHVHPLEREAGGPIAFMTDFTEAGRHALFLQFRDAGEVRTATFTVDVG